MSKISLKSSSRMLLQRTKWSKKDSKLKPFGFCCSMDRFDPLSTYDQRISPYESSLAPITSVHECPVSKMQVKFFTFRPSREKRKSIKSRALETGDQERSKNAESNYFYIDKNDRSIRWYLEDEIALAKDILWARKQKIYNEEGEKAINIGRKKHRMEVSLRPKYPRWYQDFSPDQMENLMNLENAMRADYEETKTDATQATLISIGVISTFFKLKPNIIKELHKLSNLNSVNFLQEIYRILTKNDFYEEGYKKFYDCNERIILSAIAFLTLPETVEELHKRLPAVIMPRLPPKPTPPIHVTRQKDICPYKEELFKRPDWAGYRNALQKWKKQCKLFAVPKIILPFEEYGPFFINNGIPSEIRKQSKDIYTERFKETGTRELQKVSTTKYDQKAITNIDEQVKYKDKDSSSKKNLEEKQSTTFDIRRLPDDEKKFDFTIRELNGKPESTEYKICGPPKPPGANRKSWLGEKDAQYIIGSVAENSSFCPVTYEITGVANVTPSNSDERFFAVLKLGAGKIFPGGRENLSRNWQEWLRNADEEFRQVEEKADGLIESVQATMKLAFPGPVCDSCCSCRQTRRTHEKLQQNEIPIDNVMQDGEENKHITELLTMQSPRSNPTGSPINPIASQDEIKANIIVDGVIRENGQTRYHISDIQEEKVHVPTRVPDSPAPQPVRNVPPCACAIQQMANKDVSPFAIKDDIPWTKDEGLCFGKKYRPDEPGAYSCKTYPDDKSCRRNPFIKEIMKLEKRKREKQESEEEKGKAEFIEVQKEIQKETEVPKKKITEKRKDKFIPDPDYPAYDDSWNISRTAPSPKIMKTDYEKTLKLTAPALPATFSPLRTQEKQKDTHSSNKEVKTVEQDTVDKQNNAKTFQQIFSKPSKKIEEKRNKTKEEAEDTRKRKNKERLSSKKTAVNKEGIKSSSKIPKLTGGSADKTQKRQTKSSSSNRSIKHSSRVNKLFKHGSVKKDGKKNVVDETEQLDSRKEQMARLKNMFKSFTGVLGNIQPAVLPWELPAIGDSEEKTEDIVDPSAFVDEEESRIRRGPCGWRTRSEQELPAKKTLAYICEPDYPLETMKVRPGGRPCQCRENRSKKKVLVYNVAGLVEKKRNGRRSRKTKLEEENRVIDGVFYFTPPVSPRRSDEYVPEYDLLESPYDMCVNEATDERFKLIERYSGPKSLVEKIRKKSEACDCSVTKKDRPIDQKKNLEEIRQKLMESKSPEERWKTALKDPALIDYFTQRRDNIPCWTSCKKFARTVRPRRLKVVKPVCECKYERKILERNEERAEWKARQRRLKSLKKQPFTHIVDTSRPMVEDKKFIISGVKRIPREDEYKDDVKYCISGVAETIAMSPPQRIIDGLKMSTPPRTPEPSKEDILRPAALHRHWSPTNIPPGPLPKRDAALKEEMERRKKARDEAFRLIYGDEIERDASHLTYYNYQGSYDEEKSVKKINKNHETKESRTSVGKKISEAIMKFRPPVEKTSSKLGYQKDVSREETTSKVHEKGKYFEETTNEASYQQDTSHKKIIDKTGKKVDEEKYRINGDGDKKRTSSKLKLTIIQAELKKMAAEGYTFAKLPKCHLMPQLKDWIMYREGVVFSETDKKNLMQATSTAWELMERMKTPKIEVPSLHMTKRQLKSLTYDRAEEMKEKIAKTKAIFHSKVRKARVSYARIMWGTMESGKFPSASFKRAFFTYMASKEADGHVYKPWLPSEVRERDLEFSCY